MTNNYETISAKLYEHCKLHLRTFDCLSASKIAEHGNLLTLFANKTSWGNIK